MSEPRYHTYPEAARILRCKERWLRRNASRLPRQKRGRVVLFSDADLAVIEQMTHIAPTPELAPVAVPSGLAGLRPLPSRRVA